MRRTIITSAFVFLTLGTLFAARAGSGTSAEKYDRTLHPIVGSWVVHDSSGLWPTATVLITFHSDGNVIFTTQGGMTSHGAWQPIGDQSVEFNVIQFGAGSAPESLTRFLSTAEVLDDGDTFIRSSEIIGGDKVRGERILPGGATSVGYPEGVGSPAAGD